MSPCPTPRTGGVALAAILVGIVLGPARADFLLDPRVDAGRFRITTFATGLNFPKSLQRLPDGSLLVGTSRPTGGTLFASTGELVRLVDADRDGRADGPGTVVFTGLPGPITAVRTAGPLVLVAGAGPSHEQISVLRAGITPGDALTLVGSIDLAYAPGWLHTTSGLAVRESSAQPGDFDVFFNVGSRSNDRATTDPVVASGLVSGTLNADSIYKVTVRDTGGVPLVSGPEQVAAGLRNAAGIAVQPATGDLYFIDNGIDSAADPNEPLSADELNRIAAAALGGPVASFGFPDAYTAYRTGAQVGSGGSIPPLVAFQPMPDPATGSESEGAAEIAFAPAGFPAGLNNGVFVGFHGRFNLGGLANEENPLVYVDLATLESFHFLSNDQPDVGHLDGLLATDDALFLADLSSSGELFAPVTGAIYQIQAIAAVPEPSGLCLLVLGVCLGAGWRRHARAAGASRPRG